MQDMIDSWDLSDKAVILGSVVSAALIFAREYTPAAIIVWICSAVSLFNIFFWPPAVSFRLHWRGALLYTINFIATILLALVVADSSHISHNELVTLAVIMIVIAAVTLPLYILFPKPSASKLLGPHKLIGTTSLVLTLDPSYKDQLDNKDISFDKYNSTVSVQLWFPLKPSNTVIGTLLDFVTPRSLLWTSGCPQNQYAESELLLKNISKNYGLPWGIMGHLSVSRSNSIWQDNLDRIQQLDTTDGGQRCKYPIAIYSHGMYGWRTLHTSLCESLASLGFIVIACDHAPDCMVSRPVKTFPTDHVPFDFHVPEELKGGITERSFYTTGFNRRIRDLTGILDYVTKGGMERQFPQLQDRVMYDHICLWGHSFGGGSVLGTAAKDDRISRVAALDGWIYPLPDKLRKKGIHQASILNITSELWEFGKYQVPFRRDVTFNGPSKAPRFDLVFKGTDHQNYCQTHLIAHAALLRRSKSVIGPDLDPQHVISTIEHLVAAFFLAPKRTPTNSDHGNDDVAKKVSGDVDDQSDVSTSYQAESTEDTLLKTSDINTSLQESTANKLLNWYSSGKSVTGYPIVFPAAVVKTINSYVVPESHISGFADFTPYDMVKNSQAEKPK